MAGRSAKSYDFSKAVVRKARRKTAGGGAATSLVTGNRTRGGVSLGRRGPRGNPFAELDEFGLLRSSKYRGLGVRCRQNVATAIREGFEYQGTAATTEEQVCYGELRRRGFALGLGAGPKSFQPQSPIAGSIVDFEVWLGGERIALRPMNRYWHGHLDKIASDDEKGELILAHGYGLFDIWSEDSLRDETLALKFDQYLGAL